MNETSTTYQELSSTSPKKPLYSNWKTCGIGWRAVALTFDGFLISLLLLFGIFGVLLCVKPATLLPLLEQLASEGRRDKLSGGLTSLPNIATLVTTLISTLFILGYGTLSESSRIAGTPGKYIMGLRVATSGKGQIDLTDAFARNIYKHLLTVVGGALTAITIAYSSGEDFPALTVITVASIVITVGLIIYTIVDPLAVLFSSKQQSLHDIWSDTLVIKAPGVNRWLRILFGLFLVFGLITLGTITFSMLLTTRFQQFADDFKIFDELKQNFDESRLDRSLPNNSTSVGDDSTSLRISKELALQRKILVRDPNENTDPSVESKGAETALPTPTLRPTKRDYTPYVDGLQVLSKKKTASKVSLSQSYSQALVKGLISIRDQTFQLKEAVAAMAPNTQIIVLNLYDVPVESTVLNALSKNVSALLAHEQPLVRFKILLNQQGTGCSEEEVVRYTVDFNTLKAKLPLQKKFFSFERSANEIASSEYVQFDCERRDRGFIRAEVRGSRGMLLNGSRIPVNWDIDVIVPLNTSDRRAAKWK